MMLILLCSVTGTAQESWLIPVDDPVYKQAEEFFITEGAVSPFEMLPMPAEELKEALEKLGKKTNDMEKVSRIRALNETVAMPFPFISPILELGISAFLNTQTDRYGRIPLLEGIDGVLDDDGLKMYHYPVYYETASLPSMLTAGFQFQYNGFAGYFAPTLRETSFGLAQDNDFISIPEDIEQIDIANTPLRGIGNWYSPPFDIRIGRDKLHSGPGKYSTLTLSKTMPYFDYTRFRFFHEWFSLAVTVAALNPVISNMESVYLDYIYDHPDEHPDPNGPKNGKIFRDRYKTYIHSHLLIRPFSWLSVSIIQTNLVGGRSIDFADFNPFIIFHNNWDDGTYGVPVSVSVTVVPVKGIKVYAEYLFFDAAFGDEVGVSTNPGASALMAGFSLLSQPFFEAGPGRFRLDFEATYTDAYTWGDYYDLVKFTSRFMFLDHAAGRYWMDFPLGFYLGPDCLDLHASLAYGRPGEWELELEWQTTGQGSADLYGYGDDTDFSDATNTGSAPTGTAQWSHRFRLGGYYAIDESITISVWYQLLIVNNRFDPAARENILNDNYVFHFAGTAITWKIF